MTQLTVEQQLDITKLASIKQAADALLKAAEWNNMAPDELIEIVLSLATRAFNTKH